MKNRLPLLLGFALTLEAGFSASLRTEKASSMGAMLRTSDPAGAQRTPRDARRAIDFEDALQKAKASGADIVVLQRGSDWNVLGERIYSNLWARDAFAQALGDRFVLTTVDRPDSIGSQSLFHVGSDAVPPLTLLSRMTALETPMPANQITVISSAQQVAYARSDNGTFTLSTEEKKNPDKDTLTAAMKTRSGGSLLRLDFPIDAKAKDSAPGRAVNGNFVINEVEVTVNGTPVKIDAAWSDNVDNKMPPEMAVDGISDQPANGWNAHGDLHRNRTLLLALAAPASAGAQVTVKLVCQYGQVHIPRSLSAAITSDKTALDAIRRVVQARSTAAKNAKFRDWDNSRYPRIALLDSQGRMVASDDDPSPKTMPELLAIIHRLEAARAQRDGFIAQAAKETGPAKALSLFRALELVGQAQPPGKSDPYADLRKQIAEADPTDQTGAARRCAFGPDPRDPVPWSNKKAMEGMTLVSGNPMKVKANATDADFEAAIAAIDAELKDPRNQLLTNEQIQRMILGKYHLYKVWPKHEELMFDVQREIAAFDPTTFWGIGAQGYCAMHPAMYHHKGTPMLYYGWGPDQLKPGTFSWDITDTAGDFDHAGPYTLGFAHAGGKDVVRIVRASMMDGETTIATGAPATGEDKVAPGKAFKIPLDLSAWKTGRAYKLRVELEAQPGKLDNQGTFSVTPEFVVPAGWAAPKPPAAVDSKLRARIEGGDMQGWLAASRARLCASAKLSPEKTIASMRKELAQCELLRLCTPEKVAQAAKAEGGAAFLMTLMGDTEWMESFITNPPATPQALENLRTLWTYARSDFDKPFLKRLGTALSLAYGASPSPYGLLERYKETQRAWNDGLLHASFEKLPVYLMTKAVCPGNISATGYKKMLHEVRMSGHDYLSANGLIRYLNYNPYGDWVQDASRYHVPWQHQYRGSATVIRAVGGVCGSLSTYAQIMTAGHGVPAAGAYQPGHRAYMVLQGDRWVGSNFVFGMSCCFSPMDWEGLTYSTTCFLREPVESDPVYLKAARFMWLATAQTDQAKAEKTPNLGLVRTYEAALAAQPTNYPNWIACAKYLEANPAALDDTARIDLAMRAARALRVEHQAAYAASLRLLYPALPKLPSVRRAELMLEVNREVRQDLAKDFLPYDNIATHFDRQMKELGDPKMETTFFGKLLAIHYCDKPGMPWNNWVFTSLMGWGYNRFANKPDTARGYTEALTDFFTARSEGVDPNYKQSWIVDNIRRTSDASQSDTYRAWLDMAEKLLPPLKPEDAGMSPEQVAARPKIEPFPGVLLSAKGMLQASGRDRNDKPRTYRNVLDGSAPGYFEIAWQRSPWAQVQLTGEVDVSGIVLVDTYEKPNQLPWAIPLKVMVSFDGKEWTEVARIEKAAPVHRIDLRGKAARVRFVRIERDGLGTNPENCLFHMRNFLVYGRTLY